MADKKTACIVSLKESKGFEKLWFTEFTSYLEMEYEVFDVRDILIKWLKHCKKWFYGRFRSTVYMSVFNRSLLLCLTNLSQTLTPHFKLLADLTAKIFKVKEVPVIHHLERHKIIFLMIDNLFVRFYI